MDDAAAPLITPSIAAAVETALLNFRPTPSATSPAPTRMKSVLWLRELTGQHKMATKASAGANMKMDFNVFLPVFLITHLSSEASFASSNSGSRSRSVTGEADLLRAARGVVSDAHRGRPGPDGLWLERHADVATAVHGQGAAALVAQNQVLIVRAGERDALNGQRRGAAVGERDRLVRARCADFLAPEQQGCPGDG